MSHNFCIAMGKTYLNETRKIMFLPFILHHYTDIATHNYFCCLHTFTNAQAVIIIIIISFISVDPYRIRNPYGYGKW